MYRAFTAYKAVCMRHVFYSLFEGVFSGILLGNSDRCVRLGRVFYLVIDAVGVELRAFDNRLNFV